MNHAHFPAAPFAAPTSRPGLIRRLAVALTRFLGGSDELPCRRPRRAYTREQPWIVTGTMVQQTAFGILSANAIYEVTATTRPDALALAAREIRESYPGYAITLLRAFPSSEG